jgi:Fungal Zn(2)-Cys(6) binuclear cluster domain
MENGHWVLPMWLVSRRIRPRIGRFCGSSDIESPENAVKPPKSSTSLFFLSHSLYFHWHTAEIPVRHPFAIRLPGDLLESSDALSSYRWILKPLSIFVLQLNCQDPLCCEILEASTYNYKYLHSISMSTRDPTVDEMMVPSPSAGPSATGPNYSCTLCKRRKVRCDKARPCAGCVRAGVDCIPSRRAHYRFLRRKQRHSGASHSPLPDPHRPQTTNLVTPEESPRPVPQLAVGECYPQSAASAAQTPTFSQNLWTGLNSDFTDPRTARGEQGGRVDLPDPSAFLFGSSGAVDLQASHPSPVHAFILWQSFIENVNPLSKIIHVPSLQQKIVEVTASDNFSDVPLGTVALLFAIYAAAVASLPESDCEAKFGQPKQVLQSRYLAAAQHALVAAEFLQRPTLITLQAFALFLVCLWAFCTFP